MSASPRRRSFSGSPHMAPLRPNKAAPSARNTQPATLPRLAPVLGPSCAWSACEDGGRHCASPSPTPTPESSEARGRRAPHRAAARLKRGSAKRRSHASLSPHIRSLSAAVFQGRPFCLAGSVDVPDRLMSLLILRDLEHAGMNAAGARCDVRLVNK